jgi:2,3-dihydroxybiphenyl 1,2-dioxygenase
MHGQLELAYLGVEVPDPDSLNQFLGDVIGLAPGGPAGSATHTWRNDDGVHRILVEPGPADDATYVGFEAADTEAFEATVRRLRHAGFPVEEGPGDHRRVERLATTAAPFGVAVEIVLGLERAPAPALAHYPGGFLTDGVGFGHAVFATTAYDDADRFVTAGLGLAQSDWLEVEIAEGIELEVRFFHGNERHHTIALARAPFELPRVLHHVMVETNDRDDVGAAFDRAWASGRPIPNGLGRHDNDGMFSFYVTSPAGFAVEVGHGARRITDDWDDNRRYDRISVWGHQPLRPS